ncbi:RND transporter [Actinoplanes philippinensis]|uniref:Putative drug exporter of the RND superfamily n=1 Tax=Actinoplanes philippinensis TaxID=35752 RepID=A0A1I2MSI1_9ACTN|nr:MMPL family transporter [Actinoplanes philippinensis]GIE83262.1 RND transporter [Actinoplanes philippinensis]SFF94422.1 putative drug exporter of the RND superfamily [Actinoplanes philippinensis]
MVRHRARTIALWLLAILALAGAGNLISVGADDEFTIPGSPSQTALDTLSRVFPQVSGASAKLVLTVPDGRDVRDRAVRDAVAHAADRAAGVEHVVAVVSPYDERIAGAVSARGTAAIITVQLDVSVTEVQPATRERLTAVADELRRSAGPGARVLAGGDAFADRVPKLSPTEGLGLLVALMVLLITFGSLLAAGIPLLTAVLGVGLSASLLYGLTAVTAVPSTAVMLAVMLGLAVGIDYALFILSRHRDQLRDGLAVDESIARAAATAGSAVVFAGLTVVIALVGLMVAGIPFLTTMGLAAALAVVVAVLIAVTFIPALLSVAGERLRPRRPRLRLPKVNIFDPWVRLATRRPIITILVIVFGLGAATLPASELRLALPDNGSEAHGSPARVTYDTITEHFGPGFNGPLIVTTSVIAGHDPVGDVNRLGAELGALPGVALIALATPDPKGQVGIVQVIPDSAPDSQATTDLVHRIREKYGTRVAVTGITAVGIDVSARLGGALLPFGLLVVGLSLVLLTMVFRSIAVPVKATAGYLLSVGAAFGATALVFQRGRLAGVLHVSHTGSVISFLPIILMGVLFGLAMDYEVFLVSRIREEYVHTGDARHAIGAGFTASAPVVVAAALIMFAVFAAFVPEGSTTIKPIAFALAVGVFTDAFLVRMTLVPAVLRLLGDRAWWLPGRLGRALPALDVEGEGLTRELTLADWPEPGAADVVAIAGFTPDVLRAGPGEIVEIVGEPAAARDLLYAIGGRITALPGAARTLGLVLPQRASAVRRRVVLIRCPALAEPGRRTVAAARLAPPLLLVEGLDRITGQAGRDAAQQALRAAARTGTTVIVTARDHDPRLAATRTIDLNPSEVYA